MPTRSGPVPHPDQPGPFDYPEVLYARLVGANLEAVMDFDRRSLRSIAAAAGLSTATVWRAVHVKGWVDLRTLARLEYALGEPLLEDWTDRYFPDEVARAAPDGSIEESRVFPTEVGHAAVVKL
jgi:hypothetical protein